MSQAATFGAGYLHNNAREARTGMSIYGCLLTS